MSTVIVAAAAFAERMKMMTLPRVLLTPHPMGRPVGAPGDRTGQRRVLEAALDLLASARSAGTVVMFDGRYGGA